MWIKDGAVGETILLAWKWEEDVIAVKRLRESCSWRWGWETEYCAGSKLSSWFQSLLHRQEEMGLHIPICRERHGVITGTPLPPRAQNLKPASTPPRALVSPLPPHPADSIPHYRPTPRTFLPITALPRGLGFSLTRCLTCSNKNLKWL